ncbi:hypothetical protein SAMN06296273_0812 [Nitrosomonas ureae]|uniref:Uncharacterized protein n=1 Tax=Nitrosomonas ureae TaxID=44577 RepID=A0A285BVV7_9PROT|nr:hypothetical protein SAMN06296273_0812 [Nitrosomonas ureae]
MNKVGDERFKKTTRYTISELLQDYDNFCVLLLNLTLQHVYRLFIVSGVRHAKNDDALRAGNLNDLGDSFSPIINFLFGLTFDHYTNERLRSRGSDE